MIFFAIKKDKFMHLIKFVNAEVTKFLITDVQSLKLVKI